MSLYRLEMYFLMTVIVSHLFSILNLSFTSTLLLFTLSVSLHLLSLRSPLFKGAKIKSLFLNYAKMSHAHK